MLQCANPAEESIRESSRLTCLQADPETGDDLAPSCGIFVAILAGMAGWALLATLIYDLSAF